MIDQKHDVGARIRCLTTAFALLLGLWIAPPAQAQNEDPFDAAEAELANEDDIETFEDEDFFAEDDLNDPFENVNRFFFKVNNTLDRYFFKPIARGYRTVVPRPLQTTARNVVNNLDSPAILANDLLQAEFKRAGVTLGRLVINSTFGFFGAADVAGALGLKRHREDFGQTLAVYGVPDGPFLYLPLLGPSNPRDAIGGFVDVLFDPTNWIGGEVVTSGAVGLEWEDVGPIRFGINIIDTRAQLLDQLDELERSSVDFYATQRSLYRQSREGAIKNGRIDFNELPELDEFDEEE